MPWVMDAGTKLTRLGVDVIWIGDDFGTQDRLMIAPAHNLQLQTSVEKVVAFYKTVKKFGTYPIRIN
jgi:hypothetical protein